MKSRTIFDDPANTMTPWDAVIFKWKDARTPEKPFRCHLKLPF